MACLRPSRPWVAPDLRGISSRPSWNLIAQFQFVLFYTSTPPRRFTLTFAAFSLTSHVDRDPFSKAPRISFATLQRIRIEKHLFLSSFWEDILQALPCLQKAPPPGFGYPPGGLRFSILGSLFQPPTLVGFALQSFCLFLSGQVGVSTALFAPALFCITSSATHRRFNDLIPPKKPNPLLLSGGLVRTGIVCSLERLDLLGSFPQWSA
jgi:hypothetical protein